MKRSSPKEDQFLELVQQYQAMLHKVAGAYTSSPTEREDLVQEIILQLWKAYPSYRPEYKISTWIYRIALNVSISQLRKESRRRKTQAAYQVDVSRTGPAEAAEELPLKTLYACIRQLSPIDKGIILLYLEQCKGQEIADTMGISLSNVSTRISRIKKRLSHCFQQKNASNEL